jgi:hypothetical protein
VTRGRNGGRGGARRGWNVECVNHLFYLNCMDTTVFFRSFEIYGGFFFSYYLIYKILHCVFVMCVVSDLVPLNSNRLLSHEREESRDSSTSQP